MPARFRRIALVVLLFSLVTLVGCASPGGAAQAIEGPDVQTEDQDTTGGDTSVQESAAQQSAAQSGPSSPSDQSGGAASEGAASGSEDTAVQDTEAEVGDTTIQDSEVEVGDITIAEPAATPGEPELQEPEDALDDPRIPAPGMWSLEVLDGKLTCDGRTVSLPGSSSATVELTVFDGGKTIVVDSLEGQIVTLDQTEINDTATVYEGEFVNADGAAGLLTLGFIHSDALQTIEGSTEAELQGCHAWRRLEGYPAG